MPAKPWTPRVAAVMLTCNRPRYKARAIACFNAQTYDNKELIIVETEARQCIGTLRNAGCDMALKQRADVIVHWDDDDYSFPGRIERQVQQLWAVHAVGWRELAFWDSTRQMSFKYFNGNSRYGLGSSLCYRIKEWEKQPFPNLHTGEDAHWCSRVRPYGMLSSYEFLVAELHRGNSSSHVDPAAKEWTRTPSRDEYLKKVMAL